MICKTRLAPCLLVAAAGVAHAQATGSGYPSAYGPDRYGSAAAATPTLPAAGPAARMRMLSWPGKTMASAPQASAYPSNPYPPNAYAAVARYPQAYGAGAPAYPPAYGRRADARQSAYAQQAAYSAPRVAERAPAPKGYGYAAPQQGWRAVPMGQAAPGLSGAPLPTSLYSGQAAAGGYDQRAPGASPERLASAAPPPRARYGYDPTAHGTVRFYSVHRPFGMRPDPAPIPPQFFTATADLAQPPGPLPSERVTETTASGSSHTVRAIPAASAGEQ